MVREDIVGGLKVALSRGNTLQAAMQSFYNAGYNKDEIEEAARFVMNNQSSMGMFSPPQSASPPVSIPQKPQISPNQFTPSIPSLGIPTTNTNLNQKVSNYPTNLPIDSMKKNKSSGSKIAMIILLFLILFLLVGSLVAVFFFKDHLMALFK